MNILHLHRMGDPLHYRESVRTLEYMFASAPDANCIVHDTDLPLPEWIRDVDFDLYILGPTFLCSRYSPESMAWAERNYGYIAGKSGVKVALPQDDYDCSDILDQWMEDWGVNFVYSVLPEKTWPALYKRCALAGRVRQGYTGYISQDWLDTWKITKPHSERSIDVSYRAARLPPNFGSLGQLKSDIAGRFLRSLPNNKLVLDISVEPKDTIPGKQWHHFVENSRACLVTPSGSSVLDPVGAIRTAVNSYISANPSATFLEVKKACFDDQDDQQIFSAISPRNIEAALACTVQIAVPGDYSEILKPGLHYIPLAADCSNISEVFDILSNVDRLNMIRFECKSAILSEIRLRSENIVQEIMSLADSGRRNLGNHRGGEDLTIIAHRYQNWSERASSRYWRFRALRRDSGHLLRQTRSSITYLVNSLIQSR